MMNHCIVLAVHLCDSLSHPEEDRGNYTLPASAPLLSPSVGNHAQTIFSSHKAKIHAYIRDCTLCVWKALARRVRESVRETLLLCRYQRVLKTLSRGIPSDPIFLIPCVIAVPVGASSCSGLRRRFRRYLWWAIITFEDYTSSGWRKYWIVCTTFGTTMIAIFFKKITYYSHIPEK